MPKKLFYPVVVISGILILILGVFIGRVSRSPVIIKDSAPIPNPLFNSQTANFRGQIKSINGDKLEIINSNNRLEGVVSVDDDVRVVKLGLKSEEATGASALEVGKEVLISLELVDGGYKATVIQQVAPQPSLPPFVAGVRATAKPSPAQ